MNQESFIPKRGDDVSHWLTMRIHAAKEEGAYASAAYEVMEKMLAEYHWCADHEWPLPTSAEQALDLVKGAPRS